MTAASETIWQKIEYSPVGDFVASSEWAFPTLETIHVIALVTVLGSIAVMDLRLLGLASNSSAITQVARNTVRLTWMAFILAATTGLLMFAAKAGSYMINPYFLIKMGLLALAGLNMAYFHLVTWKAVKDWDKTTSIPAMVKLSGALSLVFWVMVVFFGRAIGFTLGMFY